MKKYEYSILRYLHDQVTDEFINVGIILFSSEEKIVLFKSIESAKRISDFFNGVDGKRVRYLISSITSSVSNINKALSEELNFDGFNKIEKICDNIIPKDDSALFFSESKKGRTLDYQLAINNLYDKMVSKYESSYVKKSLSDEDVWNSFYKKHFDDYHITSKLSEKKILTAHDSFDFDLCWTNGRINIYKPISFDYVDIERIKMKIYRWDGILRELITSNNNISINFLSKKPSLRNFEAINSLILDKLIIDNDIVKSKIVFENNITEFVTQLNEEINMHS